MIFFCFVFDFPFCVILSLNCLSFVSRCLRTTHTPICFPQFYVFYYMFCILSSFSRSTCLIHSSVVRYFYIVLFDSILCECFSFLFRTSFSDWQHYFCLFFCELFLSCLLVCKLLILNIKVGFDFE